MKRNECLKNMPNTKRFWLDYVTGVKDVAKQDTIFFAALKGAIAFPFYSIMSIIPVAQDIMAQRIR
ncbi:hypothetical protein M1328_03465 [Patescibacteria group bacterium]|nr:hypothetical protein [Patescibacteria group bacterium]